MKHLYEYNINYSIQQLSGQLIDMAEYSDGGVIRDLISKGADPGYKKSAALSTACLKGHTDVVKELMKDPRTDPTGYNNDNTDIVMASMRGYYRIVEELMKDSRVDPSAQDNLAIQEAGWRGYYKVVRELLKDDRVDPSVRDNSIIRAASARTHVEVVIMFLQDQRLEFNKELADVIAENFKDSSYLTLVRKRIVSKLLSIPVKDISVGELDTLMMML